MSESSPLFMFEHHLDGICRAGMFFFALANCGVEVRASNRSCVWSSLFSHACGLGFGVARWPAIV
jgi:hypothetical protein